MRSKTIKKLAAVAAKHFRQQMDLQDWLLGQAFEDGVVSETVMESDLSDEDETAILRITVTILAQEWLQEGGQDE